MATLAHPLPGYPTPRGGEFGAPRALSMGGIHKGLDFTAPAGIPVRAAARGTVTRSLSSLSPISLANGAGNHIHITHSDRLRTDYAHLLARYVREGQPVEAGQVIGAVGSSGFATGNHLHFGVIVDGVAVDPAPYLGLAPASTATLAGTGLFPEGTPICSPPVREALSGVDPIRRQEGASCPVGWYPGHYRANLIPDNPAELVGSLFELALPPLLEPALNIAVVAGSALLLWSGVQRVLKG